MSLRRISFLWRLLINKTNTLCVCGEGFSNGEGRGRERDTAKFNEKGTLISSVITENSRASRQPQKDSLFTLQD